MKRLVKIAILSFFIASAWIVRLAPGAHAVTRRPMEAIPEATQYRGKRLLTTGGFNSAVGYFSLFANITRSFNTAVGAGGLTSTSQATTPQPGLQGSARLGNGLGPTQTGKSGGNAALGTRISQRRR
jgi:predicted amino acid dehydrogenase